ncbi:MAG: SLC13 family permease, partial [Myxococcota bacterium]
MSHPPSPTAPPPAPGLRVPALLCFVVGGLGFALLARIGVIGPPEGLRVEALVIAGVLIAMAASWIFEGMPLAATALLPMALFPLFGVAEAKTVARSYMSSAIMLLMGGFFLARGLERWGVPQRMAHFVSRRAAGSPRRLLVGLMVTTAVLSMWVSNTATTLIMVTVALASVSRARASSKNHPGDVKRFAFAVVLGIAYSANVGGITTPVGTAPNVILLGLHRKLMPDAVPVSFLEWMILTLPIAAVLIPAMAWLLMRFLLPFPADLDIGAPDEEEGQPLGPGGRRARARLARTGLLWVFRVDIDLGVVVMPGIASMLGLGEQLDDGAIAMLGVVLMFACPAGQASPHAPHSDLRPTIDEGPISLAQRLHLLVERPRVLDWETASAIPWYLL